MAKLFSLGLLAVVVTVVAAHSPPEKGGKYTGVQTLPAQIGGGSRHSGSIGEGGRFSGVQTLPGKLGGKGGIPPRTPQVQPKPYPGRPNRPTRPIQRPSGPYTRPRPRPSKGGQKYRRSAEDYDEEDDEYDY